MPRGGLLVFARMILADCIAQCRSPLIVQDSRVQAVMSLNGAYDFAGEIAACPIRYVLADDLTRLCTALAYSRGAKTLDCADLLHVPGTNVWAEWLTEASCAELEAYGLQHQSSMPPSRRRGALVRASVDGRRGVIRTFWSGPQEPDVLASSVEAYFDLDTPVDEAPDPMDGETRPAFTLFDGARKGDDDILRRCFRFRYEKSWADYYDSAQLSPLEHHAILRHALGTIAFDVPILLTFFLLLATRSGLPQRPEQYDRLNRARSRAGKALLLDRVEVRAPWVPEFPTVAQAGAGVGRRHPRLHHVRGHLVRRGSQLFWRLPHLRGSARSGVIRSRTVTWTFEQGADSRVGALAERGPSALSG
jgi:hypothetical protein